VTGFQFRYHPLLRTAKRWLEEGRMGTVVSCRAEYGEYLPSWHPEEDYRRGYSARTSLGGGPVLTLSHPFDYLRWLLGEVRSVAGSTARRSHLEIDTEDTAHATLRFASGVIGAVDLDYVQHPRRHILQIVGEGGTIHLDFEAASLRFWPADGGTPLSEFLPPSFERNGMFVDEMRNFLSALIGSEAPVCTLDDGVRALEIALAVHRSSEERKEIDVALPL
jgi:predicted dehydrogenase